MFRFFGIRGGILFLVPYHIDLTENIPQFIFLEIFVLDIKILALTSYNQIKEDLGRHGGAGP